MTPHQRTDAIAAALGWSPCRWRDPLGYMYAACQDPADTLRSPRQRTGTWLSLEWGTNHDYRPVMVACLRVPRPGTLTGWWTEARTFLLDDRDVRALELVS